MYLSLSVSIHQDVRKICFAVKLFYNSIKIAYRVIKIGRRMGQKPGAYVVSTLTYLERMIRQLCNTSSLISLLQAQ